MQTVIDRGILINALLATLFMLTVARSASAENWPAWRGPQHNGVSTETNIPAKWSTTENVVWKCPLPGEAGATPVVWEDRIFVSSADGNDLVLLCINTDGEELWRKTVGTGNRSAMKGEGNSASPSPITDGTHVWLFVGTGELACFDFEGNEVWKFNVQDRYGEFDIQFGMTSTPLLYGDRLFLQLIHGDGDPKTREAVIVALDKKTGEEIWKHSRESDARAENEHSYASLMLYDDGRLKYLLSHGADYITAHSLTDGKEIWRCGGLNPKDGYDPTLRFVASPAAVPGLIVVPTAKRGPLVALRPGFTGNITNVKEAHVWTQNITPDVPSPLIHDGLVYICTQDGDLYCYDAETGEQVYRERVHRQKHRASPVYADGKIFLTGRDGKIHVIKAGRKYELLAGNDMQDAMTASPVVSNGTLYLRTFDNLWAIRE